MQDTYRQWIMQAPVGFARLDAAGTFLEINAALADALGHEPEHLIGQSAFGLFFGPERGDRSALLRPTGDDRGREVLLVDQQGRLRPASLWVRAADDETIWWLEIAPPPAATDAEAQAGNAAGLPISQHDLQRQTRHLLQMHSLLQRELRQDPLTGLPNRRVFDTMVEALGRLEGSTVGCLMADLDHFKRVNDEYGHAVGDEVLRSVAGRLRNQLRDGDTIIRYGGEEFAGILPGAGSRVVAECAERLRRAVGQRPIRTSAGNIDITISVGGCSITVTDCNAVKQGFIIADRAMYAAKQAGRNRVIVTELDARSAGDQRRCPAGGQAT